MDWRTPPWRYKGNLYVEDSVSKEHLAFCSLLPAVLGHELLGLSTTLQDT
jgi:hypothetical protein